MIRAWILGMPKAAGSSSYMIGVYVSCMSWSHSRVGGNFSRVDGDTRTCDSDVKERKEPKTSRETLGGLGGPGGAGGIGAQSAPRPVDGDEANRKPLNDANSCGRMWMAGNPGSLKGPRKKRCRLLREMFKYVHKALSSFHIILSDQCTPCFLFSYDPERFYPLVSAVHVRVIQLRRL